MQQNQELKPFTSYQKFVIAIIALIQFTVVLDFMVMSPLSPMVMESLNISPSQFWFRRSGIRIQRICFGILSAGVADKYDRKKFLMVFYAGFVVGTLFCANCSNL